MGTNSLVCVAQALSSATNEPFAAVSTTALTAETIERETAEIGCMPASTPSSARTFVAATVAILARPTTTETALVGTGLVPTAAFAAAKAEAAVAPTGVGQIGLTVRPTASATTATVDAVG